MSIQLSARASLEESGQPATFRAPLFSGIVEALEEDRRYFVLDLGRARAGTIDLFSEYRCRLDVVDLPAGLEALEALLDAQEGEPDSRLLEDWFAARLPQARGEQVDLVLCWNLLNYLSPLTIAALGRVLAKRTAPGARLHAFIEYSATEMADQPVPLAPEGEEMRVGPDLPGAGQRPAPRYRPKDLESMLTGFSSERTMLLSNGMQEYLYRR